MERVLILQSSFWPVEERVVKLHDQSRAPFVENYILAATFFALFIKERLSPISCCCCILHFS